MRTKYYLMHTKKGSGEHQKFFCLHGTGSIIVNLGGVLSSCLQKPIQELVELILILYFGMICETWGFKEIIIE